MIRVELGSLIFNGGPTDVDDFGSLWLLQDLLGWDSPPQRGGVLDYASKDGAALLFNTYTARGLQLNGLCKTINEESFWGSYNFLMGMMGDLNTSLTLRVYEGATQKTMEVVKSVETKAIIHPGWFEFGIGLNAPDPAKYGDADSVTIAAGGSAVINNAGTYRSFGITATTTGAGTVQLTHEEANRVFYSGTNTIASGAVFDFQKRTALSGDVNIYYQLSPYSEWWPLLPGDNTIHNDGTAPVSIVYRPAWI